MRNWGEICIHVLFWSLSTWLITSSFSIESQEVSVENGHETVEVIRSSAMILKLLVCIALSAAMFYANLWLIARFAGTLPNMGAILLSAGLLLTTLFAFWIFESSKILGVSLALPASISAGTIVFYYTISVAYAVVRLWVRSDKQKQHLELEKKKAELALLRNQLHPHFLFNVLNNLLSLVDQQKNPLLADSLNRLSGLLRYVVYDTANPTVPVRKEIDFVRNYADLQLIRFEEKEVDFRLLVEGRYDQQVIEPGIFIPFVENAFKYGTEPEQHSEIRADFDVTDPGTIRFSIRNPVRFPQTKDSESGTGIRATRERLQLVYPGRHSLYINESEGSAGKFFEVKLDISTNERNHS